MATVADYLVINKAHFRLKLAPAVLPARTDITFQFKLPPGTTMLQGQPLLQYIVDFVQTPGVAVEMGLIAKVNGTEVNRKVFWEGTRDHFTQFAVSGERFLLNEAWNTLTFLPLSPTNDVTNSIDFSSVVLWFQRDSSALG